MTTMNTNVTMPVADLGSNPYRDMTLFPINDIVVDSLMESIKDTDFWDNLVVRFSGNKLADGTEITCAADVHKAVEKGVDANQQYELCYGHHRREALVRLAQEHVTLPVKYVTDDNMLKMMANENKDSNQNQIAVKLETVRQVKTSLEAGLAEFDTFTEYKKAGGDLYTNAQGFKNAVANGVGFKAIKKFLGKTWSETDIRYSYSILKQIEAGYYLQEDVIDLPSIGILEAVGNIAAFIIDGDEKKELVAPEWPMFFKTKSISEVIERASADAKGWQKVTVAQLRKAKSMLINEGVEPASFLRSGGKTAFDLVKAVKDMVFVDDKDLDFNIAALEDLLASDGFDEFAGLEELKDKVSTSIENSLSRIEAGEDDELEPVDSDGLEAELADAEDEVAVPNMFDAPESVEGSDDIIIPSGQLTATYVQTAAYMAEGCDQIIERVEEIGADDNLDAAATLLLTKTAALVFARMGREAVADIFNNVVG